MKYIIAVTGDISVLDWLQHVLEWAERHSALGSWAGAFSAVIAIFVTWSLSRAEYLRIKRADSTRALATIERIELVIRSFNHFVKLIISTAEVNSGKAKHLYERAKENSDFHAGEDLAKLSVTEWPTFGMYIQYRRYWHAAQTLLEENIVLPNRNESSKKFEEYEGELEQMRRILDAAKQSITGVATKL